MTPAAWALRYAELGWPVLPLQAGAKVPATQHGLRDATRDPEKIRAWWPPGTRRNLGAVVPAGLVVVDLDPGGAEALGALDLVLPATARQRTPRGSHHVYRLPPGAELRQTTGEVAPGVDTRTAGRGYIVCAPSAVNETPYRWEVPPLPGNVAEAPGWLLGRLSERPRREWRRVAGATVGNGARNQTLASVAGLLFRRLPPELAVDLAELWAEHRLDPPLPAREVTRTLESILSREMRRRGAA